MSKTSEPKYLTNTCAVCGGPQLGAHYHEPRDTVSQERVTLEPWQDLYPPTGKCRYCGYPPGPVCGSYECNIRDNEESE